MLMPPFEMRAAISLSLLFSISTAKRLSAVPTLHITDILYLNISLSKIVSSELEQKSKFHEQIIQAENSN
jgi:uncharacterized membrane protein